MFSRRYQRLTVHYWFIVMSRTTDPAVSLQWSPFVHYSDKIIELLWPHNCEWVFSLLCNNSQNWLNQIAYACNHRCVWMLFCLCVCVGQNKVEMCVRQGLRVCHWAGHLQKVARPVSVAPVPADVMNGGSVHLENLWIVSRRSTCWCHPLVRHVVSTLTADHVSPSSAQSSGGERPCRCPGPQ